MVPSSAEILKRVGGILEEEGIEVDADGKTPYQLLEEYIFPGLKSSKNTLSMIGQVDTQKGGIKGKIKRMIQNIVINTVEKESMQQQKFNELTYNAIEILIAENSKLKEELSKK